MVVRGLSCGRYDRYIGTHNVTSGLGVNGCDNEGSKTSTVTEVVIRQRTHNRKHTAKVPQLLFLVSYILIDWLLKAI